MTVVDILTKLSRTNYPGSVSETVNIHEAKTHLSRLLERVAAGESIVIAKAGHPIADLVPHVERKVTFGAWKGQIVYDEASFDAVDPEIQTMFYGDDAAAR